MKLKGKLPGTSECLCRLIGIFGIFPSQSQIDLVGFGLSRICDFHTGKTQLLMDSQDFGSKSVQAHVVGMNEVKNCIVSIPVIKHFPWTEGLDLLLFIIWQADTVDIFGLHFSLQQAFCPDLWGFGSLFASPVDGGDRLPHLSTMAWRQEGGLQILRPEQVNLVLYPCASVTFGYSKSPFLVVTDSCERVLHVGCQWLKGPRFEFGMI